MNSGNVAKLLCGKTLAQSIQSKIAERVKKVADVLIPGLVVVQIGSFPASTAYIRMKQKAAQQVGMQFMHCKFPEDITTEKVLAALDELNANSTVHGIIVQLPLPPHIDEQKIIDSVALSKDVDGFHILNAGALARGQKPLFTPCTPRGVMEMIASVKGFRVAGSKAVVVGRSNIVGRPIAQLLLNSHATVEITHSRARDLPTELRTADVVVAALGKIGR